MRNEVRRFWRTLASARRPVTLNMEGFSARIDSPRRTGYKHSQKSTPQPNLRVLACARIVSTTGWVGAFTAVVELLPSHSLHFVFLCTSYSFARRIPGTIYSYRGGAMRMHLRFPVVLIVVVGLLAWGLGAAAAPAVQEPAPGEEAAVGSPIRGGWCARALG
jgi:hypothetical protein